MTNTIALWLAACIVLAIIADFIFTGGHTLFFLSLELNDLVDYLQFWR